MSKRYEYTAEQAEKLLIYFKVKFPGSLEEAEAALKKADLWPEDEKETEYL